MSSPPARHSRAPLVTSCASTLFGIGAALYYARAGLTLAHYDARAHLVVARRVLDSLTPGWQQVGAVWLPLPHLLNLFPVQIDAFYRSGASAVAISIGSMGIAVWAIATLTQRTTGHWIGGAVAAALLMLNPDVLYLQSTPMSEPILFGTTFLAIALVGRWVDRIPNPQSLIRNPQSRTADPGSRTPDAGPRIPDPEPRFPTTMPAGWALVAASLTRYEAWPVIAATIALAFAALLRRGWRAADAARAVRGLALWPLWTIAAFLVNSKVSVGAWFVSEGFFVPENKALGHPWLAWTEVWRGLLSLTGTLLPWIAVAAAGLIVFAWLRARARPGIVIVLALAAAAALPWYAYYKGHPLRLRYDVPLVAAAAAIIGTGVSLLPWRARAPAAIVVVALAATAANPFDRSAPVVTESQRDAQNAAGRVAVTNYLRSHWDGQPIMMSMGSLGHYMQDLSRAGLSIHDFLHEGNGEIWKYAMGHPQPFAEWILVEEKAEGGDALYWQGKLDPRFFAGYERVAEGGNVSLYRRTGRATGAPRRSGAGLVGPASDGDGRADGAKRPGQN